MNKASVRIGDCIALLNSSLTQRIVFDSGASTVRVAQLYAALEPVRTTYLKLLREYSIPGKNGEYATIDGKPNLDPTRLAEFQLRYQEFLEGTVELIVPVLAIDDLAANGQPVQAFMALMPFTKEALWPTM